MRWSNRDVAVCGVQGPTPIAPREGWDRRFLDDFNSPGPDALGLCSSRAVMQGFPAESSSASCHVLGSVVDESTANKPTELAAAGLQTRDAEKLNAEDVGEPNRSGGRLAGHRWCQVSSFQVSSLLQMLQWLPLRGEVNELEDSDWFGLTSPVGVALI